MCGFCVFIENWQNKDVFVSAKVNTVGWKTLMFDPESKSLVLAVWLETVNQKEKGSEGNDSHMKDKQHRASKAIKI